MRALEDPWVRISLSFVCTLCRHLLCCFFLLLFLTWTFKHFDLQHSLCSMLLFFFSKGIPSHLAIDSLTHTHRHTPKNSVTDKTILEFLLHTTYPHRCRHLLDYSFIFFFFWLCFYLFFFPLHDFLTTRKRKFALSISSLQLQGFPAPPSQLISDTMAYLLSISFQLRHN